MALIVNGFVKDVLQQLPMEFAVEAQKLISITLEGSVGLSRRRAWPRLRHAAHAAAVPSAGVRSRGCPCATSGA